MTAHFDLVATRTTAESRVDHEGSCLICTARALREARSKLKLWKAKAQARGETIVRLREDAVRMREVLCNIAAQEPTRSQGIYDLLNTISLAHDEAEDA